MHSDVLYFVTQNSSQLLIVFAFENPVVSLEHESTFSTKTFINENN